MIANRILQGGGSVRREKTMTLVAILISASLLVHASVDMRAFDREAKAPRGVTLEQKEAIIRPLVRSATDCIARTVAMDQRFPTSTWMGRNAIIVDAIPSCLNALRKMIRAYDSEYGDGAGEAYFMGPYLDGLPSAVNSRVTNAM